MKKQNTLLRIIHAEQHQLLILIQGVKTMDFLIKHEFRVYKDFIVANKDASGSLDA